MRNYKNIARRLARLEQQRQRQPPAALYISFASSEEAEEADRTARGGRGPVVAVKGYIRVSPNDWDRPYPDDLDVSGELE